MVRIEREAHNEVTWKAIRGQAIRSPSPLDLAEPETFREQLGMDSIQGREGAAGGAWVVSEDVSGGPEVREVRFTGSEAALVDQIL
ncbi:hypothetical protein [Nitrospira sp. Nam74]